MSTLKSCLLKTGKALSKSDVDTIMADVAQHKSEGLSSKAAETLALEKLVRAEHKKVQGYEKEITLKGGFTDSSAFNLKEELAFAKGDLDLTVPETKLGKMIGKKTKRVVKVEKDLSFTEQVNLDFVEDGYTPEEAAAAAKMGYGRKDSKKTIKERIAGIKENFKAKLRQSSVDFAASFRDVLKDDRSWMLTHLVPSASGALEGLIRDGHPVLDTSGVVTIDETKKSLSETFKPLGENLDRWTYWMAGNRAKKLKEEGREKLFSDEDIEALVGLNAGNRVLFEKVRRDFEALNNAVTKIAVDSGLVNADDAAVWAEEGFYMPFYRISEDSTTSRGPRVMAKMGLARQQAFRHLKGGEAQLADLMTNSVMNWNHLITASLKNQAARAGLDVAVEQGLAHEISKDEATNNKDAVYVRAEGREVWYEVTEPLVLDSLMAMNYEFENSKLMKIARSFKRVFTLGVTLSANFRIKMLVKDSISAAALTGASANIAKNLYQGTKALKKGSSTEIQMRAGGATFGHSGFLNGSDPDVVKKIVHDAETEAKIAASILSPKSIISKMADAYQDFGLKLENVNRAADYVQGLERGEDLLKTTFSARDHLDHTRMGSSPFIRGLAQTVPFINAHLQSLDKIARESPGTSLKDWMDPKKYTKFKAVIGMYSVISVLAYLSIKDDEDYKATTEKDKQLYHHFKILGDDTMYRLPRPFEVGSIAYMAESVAQQMTDDEVNGKLFAERLKNTLLDTFGLKPIPQIIKPIGEVYANYNTYTGGDLESSRLRRMSKENRKRLSSSDTAVALSELGAPLSPIQIDHLVRGYLGWAGVTVVSGIDMFVTRPITGTIGGPPVKLTDYPIIKEFVKTTPIKNTEYTKVFYERLGEINEVFNDRAEARRLKDFDKARGYVKTSRDKLAHYKFYNQASKRISKINQRIKLVSRSSMKSDAKRAEIDRLTFMKNALTKRVFDRSKGKDLD